MKIFKQSLKIHFRPLLKTIPLVFVLAFFVLAMYFIQVGSNRYQEALVNKEKFKQIEQSIVKKHMNYTAYGTQGFRILFMPSPVSIFFHDSGASSDLSATLDVEERLHISGSYTGRQMYRDLHHIYGDFGGLFTLFGTLMVLAYGFLSFRHIEYLESLGTMASLKGIYLYFVTARFLLLALYFTLVTAAGIGLGLLNKVPFTGSDYFHITGYLGLWLLAAFVLFNAGVLITAIKSNFLGVTIIASLWIFLFYVSPLIVTQVANTSAAKMKPLYQQENEKWGAIMHFENRAVEEVGKFKPEIAKIEQGQQLIESYMANEYKEVQKVEQDLAKQMQESKAHYEGYGLISPTTILLSTANEMSSRGTGNLLKFYQYTQDTKDRFCQFYKYKKFYAPGEEKGVESFIKNEENIFYGKTGFPANIAWAIIELVALALILQILAYYAHRNVLSQVKGKTAPKWNPETVLNPATNENESRAKVYQIQEEGYITSINNYFSGSPDLLYLCRADHLPGNIDSGDYLDLVSALLKVSPEPTLILPYRGKRIDSMNNLSKVQLLMTVTQIAEQAGKKYYLLDDLTRAMPIEAAVIIKKRMEELNKRGSWVAMFMSSPFLNISEYENRYGIQEVPRWFDQVQVIKGILNI
ncbi:MAG: hypothetical protein MUF15_08820 [Acidobacteria bacterium]|nr:hypothetical protein [Acidobacteriota bacterium]